MDRRTLFIGSLFAIGASARVAATVMRRAEPPLARPLAEDLPDAVAGRSIALADAPMLPQRDSATDLAYNDFVVRSYRGSGAAPITLLIAYGNNQGGGLEVHRPENCYPPYGFVLGPSKRVLLDLPGARIVPATRLTATRNGLSDQLLFWTRVGTEFPTSQWQTDISVAKAALKGMIPDGVLVRLSMTTEDVMEGNAILTAFARDLIERIPARTCPLLVGEPASRA